MASKAQQIKLDNALVAPENRRVIGKCNMRINPRMKPKESTYQVVLDTLALTTCYPAFLITAEVPRYSQHMSKDSREIKYITDVIVDHLHQPWRTFASIINKRLCGNVSGLDKIRILRVQILWGMYYKKNMDFVALIWEDLAYQIDNIDSKKQDKMFYPRFTKIIIHHFLEKDKSISMRNITFMHTARDYSLLGTMRFVSRHKHAQIYGAILPKEMTNQAMLDFVAYMTYYSIASGAEPPKSKKPKTKSNSAISFEETPFKKKPTKAKKYVPSKKMPTFKPKPSKKKAPVEGDRGKASVSSDGTGFESGVPDEQQRKTYGTDEGTGTKPGVSDVPKYLSESENESWGDSDDDERNDDNSDEVTNDDDEDDDGNDENPYFTLKDYDEEEHDKECESDDDKENVYEEEDDDMYKDVDNVSQEKSYEQVIEDAHVTLTSSQKTESSKQSSSISSDFASKFLILDHVPPVVDEVASMMNVRIHQEESSTQPPYLFTVPKTAIPETSSSHTTTVPLTISMITPLPQLTTPSPAPTTISTTTLILALPDFSSLFRFDQRVSTLEQELSQLKQADHSA
ncbi:hypothetical protein Tco_1180073 [Tanacetum coccineum]